MIGLEATQDGKLTKINKAELYDNVDSSKVKIVKTLVTPEDLDTIAGDCKDTAYPVIPGRIAIGQISDANANAYLTKGTRVYVSPIENCGKCPACIEGKFEDCSSLSIAGKNATGFLRDFAVLPNKNLHQLPPSVGDKDALLIDYIAVCLSAIEKLDIKKGEHVAVIGGGVLGTILALLIIYIQAVPILIDNNNENLARSRSVGVYYTFFSDNKVEREVSDRTGARMAQKVVYISDSNINTDLALKLAAHNATIGFVGYTSPSLKVSFSEAMKKQLRFVCVTNGWGMEEQAINVLANKEIDFSCFSFPSIKFETCETALKKAAKEQSESVARILPLIMDMM